MVSGGARPLCLRQHLYDRFDAAEIAVEICAACHPLFTGQQKLIDTAGRVDKFNQRAAAAKRKQEEAAVRRPLGSKAGEQPVS